VAFVSTRQPECRALTASSSVIDYTMIGSLTAIFAPPPAALPAI
jgi:hypothetical protein